jgi:hypothetical protein
MFCTCCDEANPSRATCVGRYDNMEFAEPACDEHCGHGAEDGACFVVVAVEDEDEWRCSCGDGLGRGEGVGGIEGAHAHLKMHMDEMNMTYARRALGEDV